jgi:hypothetical protein
VIVNNSEESFDPVGHGGSHKFILEILGPAVLDRI